MKKSKRIVACLCALALMLVAVPCMRVNAASVGSFILHYTKGAPSVDNTTSQGFNFTTASSTTIITVTSASFSDSNSCVALYSSTGIYRVLTAPGTVSATGVEIGIPAYASAELHNIYDVNYAYANGNIYG